MLTLAYKGLNIFCEKGVIAMPRCIKWLQVMSIFQFKNVAQAKCNFLIIYIYIYTYTSRIYNLTPNRNKHKV